MSQKPAEFFPISKGVSASLAQKRILFLAEVLCFQTSQVFVEQSVAPIGFFLTEVVLSHEHTDSPMVRASDMSQVSTYTLCRHSPEYDT